MVKENTLFNLEKILIYLLAVTQFIPQLEFIFYIYIFGALLVSILTGSNKSERDRKSYPFSLIVLALFVFINIVSILYSSNVSQSLKNFEKLIPFICIILYFSFGHIRKKYDVKRVMTLYSSGALFTLILILILSFYHLIFGNLKAQIIYSGISNIDYFNFLNHRTYLSFSLIMAIPLWFYNVSIHKRINKIPYVIAILFLLIFIAVSGSRAAILSALLVSLNALYFIYFKKFSIAVKASLLSAGIIFFMLVFLFHPRFELTREFIKENENIARVEPRIKIWLAGYETLKVAPVFGVGIGDMRDALDQTFIDKDYVFELNNKFNCHNQYLQTALGVGLIGLVLLLSIFIFLYFEVKNKLLITSFIIVVAINFMFESMLERNIGVFPLVFWMLIFIDSVLKREKVFTEASVSDAYYKTDKYGIIILLLVFIIFVSSTRGLKFDSFNPGTYMLTSFKPKNIKNDNNFSVPFKKYASVGRNDVVFRPYVSGSFSTIAIKDTILNEEKNIDFSLWCNISKSSNIDSVYLYLWDKNKTSLIDNYVLSEKGKWQKLLINGISIKGNINLGLRFDLVHELKEPKQLEGNIMISKPEYKFY